MTSVNFCPPPLPLEPSKHMFQPTLTALQYVLKSEHNQGQQSEIQTVKTVTISEFESKRKQ